MCVPLHLPLFLFAFPLFLPSPSSPSLLPHLCSLSFPPTFPLSVCLHALLCVPVAYWRLVGITPSSFSKNSSAYAFAIQEPFQMYSFVSARLGSHDGALCRSSWGALGYMGLVCCSIAPCHPHPCCWSGWCTHSCPWLVLFPMCLFRLVKIGNKNGNLPRIRLQTRLLRNKTSKQPGEAACELSA